MSLIVGFYININILEILKLIDKAEPTCLLTPCLKTWHTNAVNVNCITWEMLRNVEQCHFYYFSQSHDTFDIGTSGETTLVHQDGSKLKILDDCWDWGLSWYLIYLVRVDDDVDRRGETEQEMWELDSHTAPQRFKSQLTVHYHLG